MGRVSLLLCVCVCWARVCPTSAQQVQRVQQTRQVQHVQQVQQAHHVQQVQHLQRAPHIAPLTPPTMRTAGKSDSTGKPDSKDNTNKHGNTDTTHNMNTTRDKGDMDSNTPITPPPTTVTRATPMLRRVEKGVLPSPGAQPQRYLYSLVLSLGMGWCACGLTIRIINNTRNYVHY